MKLATQCANRILGSVTALLLASGAIAGAQTSDGGVTTAPVDADRATVATIVMNALTQVKLCDLAVEKSTNRDVKALCRKVMSDNARTALAGMQLAQALGDSEVKFVPSPDTPAVLDSLDQYAGSDFDRQFLLGQIHSDESDENSLRYAVEFTADKSVRRYESSVLPSIERHLELAESALQGVSEANP